MPVITRFTCFRTLCDIVHVTELLEDSVFTPAWLDYYCTCITKVIVINAFPEYSTEDTDTFDRY